MAKITLNSILSGFNLSKVNDNFQKIEDELNERVLYRDNPPGESNTLKTDVDANSHHIFNLPAPITDNEPARLKDVKAAIAGQAGLTANLINFEPTSAISSNNVQGAIEEAMEKAKQTVTVEDFGVVGVGGDDTAVIQSAINVATGVLEFSQPAYRVDGQLVWKNGVIYRGRGVNVSGLGGTKIVFNSTTDATKIVNPLNSSTPANIRFENIYFHAPNLSQNQAILFDTGSTYVQVANCRFYSSGDGIILDQSELWDIEHSSFLMAGPNSCGIWIVNGPDKQVGSTGFFTNRIGVRSCDFNGGSTATGIRDDGGVSHTFENNNYNACGSHIIATGVNGLKIDGGEFEMSSGQSIICGTTKRMGGIGGKCPSVHIANTFLYNNIDQPVLAIVPNAVGKLEFTNNTINTSFGNPLSNVGGGCDEVIAYGNTQVGIGVGGASINNHIDIFPAVAGWIATTASPTLGSGQIVASYSRKGRIVTFRQKVMFASDTTPGTGVYLFPLPFPADSSGFSQIGSGLITIIGTGYFPTTAKVSNDGLYVNLFADSSSEVGDASPGVWTNFSSIEFQITYVAQLPI